MKNYVLTRSAGALVNHPNFLNNNNLVVTGHPGIGKSASIIAMMKKCMSLTNHLFTLTLQKLVILLLVLFGIPTSQLP